MLEIHKVEASLCYIAMRLISVSQKDHKHLEAVSLGT